MNRKQQTLVALYESCRKRNDYVFHNDEVREACRETGFGNQYDVTKIDTSEKLPDAFREGDGIYVVHLGRGQHQFVSGISSGFHEFEMIEAHEEKEWDYKQSILNEVDTSESNILSVSYNQLILGDFLYPTDRRANPNVYISRRTSFTGEYTVNGQAVLVNRLQMEIDMVLELNREVTILEGKNRFPRDFAVYQLFHPHLHYQDLEQKLALGIRDIQCCYLLRQRRKIRLYLYRFHGSEKSSIELIKKAEYALI